MKLQLLPWQKSKEELLNKWNEINRDYGPCGEAMLIIPRKDDVLLVMFLITDDFDRDDDEDEDEDKIQISYSVGFYEGGDDLSADIETYDGGDDLSADIETYDGGFVSYLASKGTGLETIVQELADFCDDRDETRFGEDYYILSMQ
jgi:hypothetical protein